MRELQYRDGDFPDCVNGTPWFKTTSSMLLRWKNPRHLQKVMTCPKRIAKNRRSHGAIARWAQRGTRTRSLEIRSLARYHCASRARIVVAAMIIERQNKTYCLGLGLSFTFSRMQRDDDMQVKSPIAHSKDKLLTHHLRWFWWLLVWYWQRHPGWKDVIEIRVCCFLHGS